MKYIWIAALFTLVFTTNVDAATDHSHCMIVSYEAYQEIMLLQQSLLDLEEGLGVIVTEDPKEEAAKQFQKDMVKAQRFIKEVEILNQYQVLMCVESSDVEEINQNWNIEGEVGFKIAKYLEIVQFESTFTYEKKKVQNKYLCSNTETGELFHGTIDEIIDWYAEYLEDR